MKRVMVDIETLGTHPNAAIVSVGWVDFDLAGIVEGSAQEVRISIEDSFKHGLGVDGATIDWWLQQPGNPWRDGTEVLPLGDAMNRVRGCLGNADEVWAKPPGFDLKALSVSMRAVGLAPTWTFREECCFRTLKRLSPLCLVLPTLEGTKHGALDDAIQQAREASVILSYLTATK